MTSSDKLTHILSSLNIDSIRTYVNILDQKDLTSSEIQSKLDSTQKFIEWAYYSDKISFSKYQQIKDEIANFSEPMIEKASTEALNKEATVPLNNSDSMTPKKEGFLSKLPFFGTSSQDIPTPSFANRPIVFISVALLLLGTAIVGRGIYDRFFSNTDASLAYAPTPVVASRILSFQGRLTDSLGNPITASTNMRFRLYTASSGGSTLYDSGTCSIAPDQDGVHNVLIGSDCGAEVGSSVFTENGEVYLGVTVGADSEMTPRQRMANVPYAQNSETLQGLPLGKDVSSVPYINNAGDLLISAASPQIGSTYASQAFLISSAQAVTLQSAGAGDVTLTATGSGELKFLVGGATAGVVNNSGNWGIKSSNPSTFELQVNGDVGPETDSAFDLGSNSVRWANVYADNIIGTITPGFTAGSVAFADGSGNLAQDNAQFFWDDTVNKLGIGTPSPLGKFHLTGAASGKALAILNETGDQNIITASASGTTVANLDRSGNLSVEGALSDLSGATLEVNDNLDISGTLTSGTANAFSVDATGNISTSGTTGLTFSSTGGIVLAGGTITDGTDGVDINDDLEIAGGTTLGDNSADTVTANAASWTFANDTNYILSGGINGLSIDSTTFSVDGTNDRIGIGTAAPDAAWLDIAAATTAKSQLNLTTSAGTDVSAPNSGDLWWNGTNLYFYDGSTNSDLLGTGGGTPGGSDTQLQYNNGGSFGGATALTYDDTNHRVGIGTATSPTSLFHVAGATTGKALAIFDETGDQNIITASASGTTVANLDRSGNFAIEGSLSDLSGTVLNINDGLSIAGNTTLGDASGDTVTSNADVWTFANDTTVALTGGVNGLNFDSNTLSIDATNNRIGIGTAAPGTTLHLNSGDIRMGAEFDLKNTVISGVGIFDVAAQGSISQAFRVIPGSSPSYSLFSLPTASFFEFHRNNSGTDRFFLTAPTDSTNGYEMTSYSSGTPGPLTFNFATNTSTHAEAMRLTNAGKLGIGSSAPDGKLQVTGAVTGKALTIFDETGDQAILTASASGTTRYTLANNGNITYSPSAFGSPITLYDSDTSLPNANTGIVDAINDAYTAAIGGGGGLWTDSATTTYLTTTTDDVVIGGSAPLSSGKLSIDGDADQIQLIVQGNGTQTSSLAVFEQSDGTDVLTISNAGNLAFAGGTLSDATDGVDIADDLEISGGTTLGDASGDTVTANAGAWTFANDTTVALSGGLNGLNFDSDTLSIDAANNKIGIGTAAPVSKFHVTGAVTGKALAIFDETGDQDIIAASSSGSTRFRVSNDGTIYGGYFLDISNTSYGLDPAGTSGFGGYSMKITGGALLAADSGNVGIGDQTPDAKLNVLSTTEQLRLDYDDNNYLSFTVSSGGDLTLDSTGGDINLANADVLNIGGNGDDVAFSAIGDDTANAGNVNSDNDLYIEDDLEVDGTIFGNITGTITPGFTAGSVVFTGSAGELAQDNASFFFDDSANELGIGDTTPDAKVDITAATEQLRLSYETGDTNYASFTVGSSGDLTIAPTGGDLAVTGNADISGGLNVATGNHFNVDTSGNIGIGTTAASGYGSRMVKAVDTAGLSSYWLENNAVTYSGIPIGGTYYGEGNGITNNTTSGGPYYNVSFAGFTNNSATWVGYGASGNWSYLTNDAAANSVYFTGFNSATVNSSTGTSQDYTNYLANVTNQGTGTISVGRNLSTHITNSSSGTISTAYGFLANSPTNASGTITTIYGARIDDQSVGTNTTAYGVYIANQSGSSGNAIGLYIADADDYSLQLASTDGDAASGITFGTDTNLYRSAANTLHTDDALDIDGAFTTDGDIAVNGDDITSDGNLTINATGYVRIGDTASPGTANGDDDLFVEGDLEVDAAALFDGNVTIGNASGDTVTSNADAWTFANDTTVALTGGVNGLNFDSNTLSIDGANDRIGIGTAAPSLKLDIYGPAVSTFTNNPALLSLKTTDSYAANMGGGIIFGGAYLGTNTTEWAYIGGVKENGTNGNYAGRLVFGTRTDGSGATDMTRMIISSTGDVGIGTTGPDAKLDVLSTTEQLRLTYTDGSAYSGFTVASTGDLTIDSTGGDINFANADVLNIGGNGDDVAFNAIGDDTASAASVNSDNDLYIEDDLEVDGTIFGNISGTITPGFTAGSVVFTGSAGELAQDNASFFFDDTTNKLGLGTASPTGKFTVTGAATGKALAIFNETGDQNIISASASGTTVANLDRSGNLAIEGALSDLGGTTLDISDNLDVSGTLTSGTANAFVVDASGNISTSGTTGLTFSSTGGIVLAGGTISDGTDGVDISDDLEIAGGTTLGDNIADTVTANAGAWTFANDTTVALSGGVNGLNFDSNTLSIDALNNTVGIGTAAPNTAVSLEIYDTSRAGLLVKSDGAYYATFQKTDNTNGVGLGYDLGGLGESGLYDSGGDSIIAAYDGGDSNYLYAAGNLIYTSGGNLGVGTAGPDAKIDALATTEQLRLTYTDGTVYTSFTTDSAGDLTIDPTGADIIVDGDILPNTDDTYDLGSDSKRWKDIYLGPDTLHIGTSTTDEGTIGYVTSTNVLTFTNNYGDTNFGSTSDGFNFTLGGGAGDDLIVDTTTLVVESDNDRVGIGTAEPDAKFHVTGASTGKALAIFNETGNQNVFTASVSGATVFTVTNNGDVVQSKNGSITGLADNESLAPNPSFEIDSDGVYPPDGWSDRVGTNTTSSTSNHGDTAILLDTDTDEIISNCFPMAGGNNLAGASSRTYTISIWSRLVNITTSNGLNTGLYEYTSKADCLAHTNSANAAATANGTPTNVYQYASATLGTQQGRIWARAYVLYDYTNNNNDLLIDGVMVSQTSNAQGLDLAETYPAAASDNIEIAEIVSFGTGAKQNDADVQNIVRSSGAYDDKAFGVVATQPGLVLDDDKSYSKVKVALKGRVPVLVTTENGPIKVGDPITASSIPGAGMKATRSGRIIGYAMTEYTNPNATETDVVTVFVNPETYIDMSILTDLQESVANINLQATAQTVVNSSVQALDSLLITTEKLVAQTIEVTNATIDTLIVDGIIARDVETQNLAAVTATIQDLETDTISTTSLDAEKVTTDTLNSDTLAANSATISGTLVADNVDARNITEMRERLERLAASQDDSTVTSDQLDADLAQVQQYIDELTQSQSPENITDVETYQVSPPDISLDAGSTETSLGQNVSAVNLESLIVTGTSSMTSLTVADAFSAGNIFIQDNSVVSMVNELKLTALESVDIMNGGVIIAKGGTLTAKGEVIAQKGVRTNTIKSLDGNSDVSVDLGQVDNSGTHSSFKVQADGNDVALIDSQGSANFKNLSLSTYNEATSSAVVIAAGENYRQTGLYAPAIKTNATASGNGILPSGENDIIIFNDLIKKDSIVNLTPTSTTQNRSVYVDKVEACLDDSNELCQPYFRVAIDDTISNDVTFNWLLVN